MIFVRNCGPFDISDEDLLLFEDRLERLEKVSRTLTAKVSRVCKAFKEKKFRRHPEQLDEKEISCSQYSLFQSPDSDKIKASQNQDISGSDESDNGKREMETSQPSSYKKRPLNHKMSPHSRCKMVKWAAEEGITVTQLLGYLLYLDNYHKGERSVSAVGWQIFQEEKFSDRNSASLEEALWLIEQASLSQAVYLEIQFRF